jgi:rare lipoprotein A
MTRAVNLPWNRLGLSLLVTCCFTLPAAAEQAKRPAEKPVMEKVEKNPKLDRTGKKRKGKASYYGRSFAGKTMADGTPMKPESNVAASKTLPLGTTARVTNLENGKTAEVEIRDRGPYVEGRTVDLSPRVARDLGIVEQGVAPVEVAPIAVPQRDGTVTPGEGAAGS